MVVGSAIEDAVEVTFKEIAADSVETVEAEADLLETVEAEADSAIVAVVVFLEEVVLALAKMFRWLKRPATRTLLFKSCPTALKDVLLTSLEISTSSTLWM